MNKHIRTLMAAQAAALLLAGCQAVVPAPAPAQSPEETAPAEAVSEDEAAEETEAAAADTGAADTADETAAASDTASYEDSEKLPKYTYTGDEKYLDVISDHIISYETAGGLSDAAVYIPYSVIVETDETNPSDIKVYGAYGIDGYNLLNTTLMSVTGSLSAGIVHLSDKGDGTFEVISSDLPMTGEESMELFAPVEGLYEKVSKAMDTEAVKAQEEALAEYVSENGLNITQYQHFGYEPIPIGTAVTPEEAQSYRYASPLGYEVSYDLRDFTLSAYDDSDMIAMVNDNDSGTFMIAALQDTKDPDEAIALALSDAEADSFTCTDAVIGDGISCRKTVYDETLEDGRIFRYVGYAVPVKDKVLTILIETTWEKGVSEMSTEDLEKVFKDMLASFALL